MSILASKDWSISALQEGNKESSYIWFDFPVMKQPIAPCQKRSTVGILLGFTWLLPVNKEIRSNTSFIKHEFLWVRSIKNDNRFLLLHIEYFSQIFCYLPRRKQKLPSFVILGLVYWLYNATRWVSAVLKNTELN